MGTSTGGQCCFRDCRCGGFASLRVGVTPPPDGAPVIAWAHEACFEDSRDPSVGHDDPKDHGRIPAHARCVFCGYALPLFGEHPYVVDLGSFSPPHRFWSHAKCIGERLASSVMQEIHTRLPPDHVRRPGPAS